MHGVLDVAEPRTILIYTHDCIILPNLETRTVSQRALLSNHNHVLKPLHDNPRKLKLRRWEW
jgi:hypothetical protein